MVADDGDDDDGKGSDDGNVDAVANDGDGEGSDDGNSDNVGDRAGGSWWMVAVLLMVTKWRR